MQDSAYLIFSKNGLRRMVKGYTGPSWSRKHVRPALKEDEYAVRVTVNVPDSVFAPRSAPEATITIPESAVLVPSAEVSVDPMDDAATLEAKEQQ